jgi:hypothetical protein
MRAHQTTESILACCHGYTVWGADRLVGTVETPVFSGTGIEPDSLLVRTGGRPLGLVWAIDVELVAEVSREREEIVLAVPAAEALAASRLGDA